MSQCLRETELEAVGDEEESLLISSAPQPREAHVYTPSAKFLIGVAALTALVATAALAARGSGSYRRTIATSGFVALAERGRARAGGTLVVEAARDTPAPTPAASDCDDAALWVNPEGPASSLVVGTLKRGGLDVYNLQGERVDHIDVSSPSKLNNVDVLDDLVVVSDHGQDILRFFRIGGPKLEDVTADDVPLVFSADKSEVVKQFNALGITLAKLKDGKSYAFVTRHFQGDVAKLELVKGPDGKMTYKKVGSFTLPMRFKSANGKDWDACSPRDDTSLGAEGMVVDTDNDVLFVAQEWVGLFALSATEFEKGKLQLLHTTDKYLQPYDRQWNPKKKVYDCNYKTNSSATIISDAEGLSFYKGSDGRGVLVLSAQGDNKFSVFDRVPPYTHLGNFKVALGNDKVVKTDGVEVRNADLGPDFPLGLLIVMDGDGKTGSSTNFKYVSWEKVMEQLPVLRTRT